MAGVKTTRAYQSAVREDQARRTREAILDSAQRFFLADGYAATKVSTIARDAGVSLDTVYKAFGRKPGLVRAIHERAHERHTTRAYRRADEMRIHETDPHKIVHNWGMITASIAPIVNPVLLLLRSAAATDPDVVALWEQSSHERRERVRHNAQALADAKYLRKGVTVTHATDVLWVYVSPDLYELLVLQSGWTLTRFGRFVGDSLASALLPPR